MWYMHLEFKERVPGSAGKGRVKSFMRDKGRGIAFPKYVWGAF